MFCKETNKVCAERAEADKTTQRSAVLSARLV